MTKVPKQLLFFILTNLSASFIVRIEKNDMKVNMWITMWKLGITFLKVHF